MTTLSFIGREAEQAAIRERLNQADCRLLTIIGAGGVGKTRLAREIARDSLIHPVFVLLDNAQSAEQVYAAIASALDVIIENVEETSSRVVALLQVLPRLLILDNYEQLLPDVTPVRALLDGTANTRLIVTSRERLNLRDEWVFRLDGLQVHDDAIRLFIDRAKQSAPSFDPEREVQHVAAICKAVEGLPLAIELAASWLTVMPCSAIAGEIASNLTRLKSPHRDTNVRHASLEAVFEGTWRLLTPDQAEQIKRLSVFGGGFSRIAAEAVARTTLEDLRAFIDKSLIRHDERGRYHMHELLRQFADSKLSATERANAEADHGLFTLNALKQAERSLKGAEQVAALDTLETDLANISQAWRIATENGNGLLLADAAESLRLLAIMRSRIADVRRLYEVFIADAQMRVPAAAYRKILLRWLYLRDWDRTIESGAEADVTACYAAAVEAGDMIEASFARRVQGHIAFGKAEYATARAHFQDALQNATDHDRLELLRLIGHTYLFDNQSEEALPYYRDSLKIAEAIGDRIGAAVAWMGIGGSMRDVGDYDGAYRAHYAAYELQKVTRNWGRYAWNLTNLADAAFRRGDIYAAAEHLAEAREAAARTEGRMPDGFREYLQALVDGKLREYEAIRSSLSQRELEVLRLLAEGLTNAQIAERLVVEVGTIKLHVHRILKKLSAENRAHAAALTQHLRI